MCSRKFSPSDDQRLVNSVKAFPVLFNHERFFVIKNPDIIRENWRAVSSEVGRDEEACRKSWRDIRDHYFKVKRKQQASKDHQWTTRGSVQEELERHQRSLLQSEEVAASEQGPPLDYKVIPLQESLIRITRLYSLFPEEACRKRWRDIRDHYFKVKRKQQASKDHQWTTRWPLYKSLSFLANAKRKKRHPSDEDFSDQELTQDGSVDIYQPEMTFKVEDDSQASPSQLEYVDVMASPRREADTSFRAPSDSGSVHFLEDPRPWGPQMLVEAFAESRRRDGEDDIDVFMKSVALSVKRLSPKARAEAKLKILSVVTELEFPAETKSGEDC